MKLLLLTYFVWAFISFVSPLRFVFLLQPIVSLLGFIIGINLVSNIEKAGDRLFELNNLLFLDSLNGILILVILFIAFFVSIYSIGYMRKEIEAGIPEKKINEFFFWMNLFIAVMLLLSLSNNFGILWIAIEGTTLATAFLISFYRNKEAVEAGWKYIMLCSIGIGFALFGIIVIYFASFSVVGEGLKALNWTEIYQVADKLDKRILLIGFIFIVVGFGTKVGFSPLHFWLPDAHSQAPTPISALMSGVLLNCAFYSIVRVQAILNHQGGGSISDKFLLFFGLFTVIVSALFILRQTDYKRLLAYSSMEHMGIIAFAFGINTKMAVFAGLYHLINHAIVKTSIFMTVGSVLTTLHLKEIFSIKGLLKSMPYTSAFLILTVFAITGTPPFSIFMSELYIILSAFKESYTLEVIILLTGLTVIFGGFIYHFLNMVMGESDKKYRESSILLLPVVVLVVVSVISSFYLPDKVITLINNAVEIVGAKQ